MWLWRKVLNTTWSDKVCNEEVLRRDGEERAIISVINRRQRVWLGHTLRHGDLVPLLTEGRIIGKRPPRRPRVGMLDRVKGGSPYVAGQEARLRSRTTKMYLPVGRAHTHTPIGYSSVDDLRRADLLFTDLRFIRIRLLV